VQQQTITSHDPRPRHEACRTCGAILAEDQLYCLECGERRGEPRLALEPFLTPVAPAPAQRAPDGPAPLPAAATYRPLNPSLAGIALAAVALALIAGVLIGRGDNSGPKQAAIPVTVTVPGGAAAASAAPATQTAAADSAKTKHAKGKQAPAKSNAQVVSRSQLNQLQNLSGKAYQKATAKPKTVLLPGKPPPKDNKKPGGGSPTQTIG
jgi:negative regulator of sigma E activity